MLLHARTQNTSAAPWGLLVWCGACRTDTHTHTESGGGELSSATRRHWQLGANPLLTKMRSELVLCCGSQDICVSPKVSRGCCVLAQNLAQDIHLDRQGYQRARLEWCPGLFGLRAIRARSLGSSRIIIRLLVLLASLLACWCRAGHRAQGARHGGRVPPLSLPGPEGRDEGFASLALSRRGPPYVERSGLFACSQVNTSVPTSRKSVPPVGVGWARPGRGLENGTFHHHHPGSVGTESRRQAAALQRVCAGAGLTTPRWLCREVKSSSSSSSSRPSSHPCTSMILLQVHLQQPCYDFCFL